MLDHLSGGRLELGVGRGISPPEHEMWGLEPDLARQRSEEALEIICQPQHRPGAQCWPEKLP